MEHLIFRFTWVAYVIAVSIAANVENTTKFNCPCRLIAECSDGILKIDSENSSSSCKSPDMIRCCAFLDNEDLSVNNTALYISQNPSEEGMKHTLNDTLRNPNDYPVEQIEYPSSVKRELPPEILPPPVNVVSDKMQLDDAGMSKLIEVKYIPLVTEFAYPEYIKNRMHPPIEYEESTEYVQVEADSASDKPYTPEQETYPVENEEYSPHVKQLIDKAINFESMRISPKDRFTKRFLNRAESNQSGVTSQLSKRNVSNLDKSDVDELRLNSNKPSNFSGTSEASIPKEIKFDSINNEISSTQSLSKIDVETTDDNTQLNTSVNNRAAMGKLLEFGESVVPGNVQTTGRYKNQSMVSSSSKDVPTTTVNSLEQKTSSETFLSLDRISTQPINKNTPTTNKSEAMKNSVGVFTTAKRNNPSFSRNANKIRDFVRNHVNHGQNKPRERTNTRRQFSRVGNATMKTITVPKRNESLRVLTHDDRLISSLNTSATSQKDILNEKITEIKYKNDTLKKKETKSQVNRPILRTQAESEGSIGKNAKKSALEVTTATVPMKKLRLPPRVLPTRPTPHKKERNSTNTGTLDNSKRHFSDNFRRFYEMRKNIRLNNNNKLYSERMKATTSPSSVSEDPISTPTKKNNETIEGKTENNTVLNNSTNSNKNHSSALSSNSQDVMPTLENITHPLNVSPSSTSEDLISIPTKKNNETIEGKTENTTVLNNSINSNKNHSSALSSNSQDIMLTLENITYPLNVSQKNEKLQTEPIYVNDVVLSPFKNISNTSSKAVTRKLSENNLEHILKSEVNKDHTQKHFSVDSQSSRNKTQTARPSEPSSSSVNTASDQVLDASDKAYSTADIASNLDTGKIIEASPRLSVIEASPQPTIIVNRTEIFDNMKNSSLSVTVISDKLDMSNKTDLNDLKEKQEKENILQSKIKRNILLEMRKAVKNLFIEKKERMNNTNENGNITSNNYTKKTTSLTKEAEKDTRNKVFSMFEIAMKRLDPVHNQFDTLYIIRHIFFNTVTIRQQ